MMLVASPIDISIHFATASGGESSNHRRTEDKMRLTPHTLHRFRAYIPGSQLTFVPIASFMFGSGMSISVAASRLSSESCTRLAFLSFFSSEGIADRFGCAACERRQIRSVSGHQMENGETHRCPEVCVLWGKRRQVVRV